MQDTSLIRPRFQASFCTEFISLSCRVNNGLVMAVRSKLETAKVASQGSITYCSEKKCRESASIVEHTGLTVCTLLNGLQSVLKEKVQPYPVVLSSNWVLKLLKLAYYLLDWENLFVFCVYEFFFFILIESGRVIPRTVMPEITNLGVPETPGCMESVFVWLNVTVKTVMFLFESLDLCLCVQLWLMFYLVFVCVCVCTSGWVETTGGRVRVRTVGSLSCNELYWFCRQHSKSVCCNIIKRMEYKIAVFNEDIFFRPVTYYFKCRSRASKQNDAV